MVRYQLVALLATSTLIACETTDTTAIAPLSISAQPVTLVSSTTTSTRYSKSDLDLLYRTVWGEVRNQSDLEIKAVVHVIRNRLESGAFGYSLAGVLTFSSPGLRCTVRRDKHRQAQRQSCHYVSYHAFSVWNSFDPGRRMARSQAIVDTDAFLRVKQLCDEALVEPDFTGGMTHYYHPASMRGRKAPDWARHGYEAKRRIGAGVFVRRDL